MNPHLSKGLASYLTSKWAGKWASLLLMGLLVTGGLSYSLSRFWLTANPQPATPTAPQPQQIGALGRLEPATEVIKLSAPLALDGDRVAELRVKAGDRVQAGQILAVMDSQTRLRAAVQQAEAAVGVAEARLIQIQAGAKIGEIAAQQAEIARLEAELQGQQASQSAELARWQAEVNQARADLQRFQALFQQGAVAASTLDEKRLALQTAQAQLQQVQAQRDQAQQATTAQIQQAQATLNQIAEVRPVDVQTARRELDEARAGLAQAKTELAQAEIRAPIAGQILKVHAHPGEKLDDDGLVDLAQTDQMMVVAEVYQADIAEVKLGQPAQITGDFAGELQGSVAEIGLQVSRQNVFSSEPGENLDQRVVEVKIRLTPADSQKVAGLTNLQVQADISVSPPRVQQAQPPQTQPQETQPETAARQAQPSRVACGAFGITNDRFSLNRLC